MTYGDWAQWRRRRLNIRRRMVLGGPTAGCNVFDANGVIVEPESTEWAKRHGWKEGEYTSTIQIARAMAERR